MLYLLFSFEITGQGRWRVWYNDTGTVDE